MHAPMLLDGVLLIEFGYICWRGLIENHFMQAAVPGSQRHNIAGVDFDNGSLLEIEKPECRCLFRSGNRVFFCIEAANHK
jgi:hypothetical protein